MAANSRSAHLACLRKQSRRRWKRSGASLAESPLPCSGPTARTNTHHIHARAQPRTQTRMGIRAWYPKSRAFTTTRAMHPSSGGPPQHQRSLPPTTCVDPQRTHSLGSFLPVSVEPDFKAAFIFHTLECMHTHCITHSRTQHAGRAGASKLSEVSKTPCGSHERVRGMALLSRVQREQVRWRKMLHNAFIKEAT